MEPFRHRPLQSASHIRLLQIVPSSGKAALSNTDAKPLIQCTMKQYDTKSLPPYDTLSYTWGSPFALDKPISNEYQLDRMYPISINGKCLNVKKNLHEALSHLVGLESSLSSAREFSMLHGAANQGKRGEVELLLHQDAPINAKDAAGKTPLHYAAEKGHVKIVEILTNFRADPTILDKNGRTPLACAQHAHPYTRNPPSKDPMLRNIDMISNSFKYSHFHAMGIRPPRDLPETKWEIVKRFDRVIELLKQAGQRKDQFPPDQKKHPLGQLIWIDAICINQANIKEKSQQVKLMDQIYSRASRSLVWLGATADRSDLAFDSFAPVAEDGSTQIDPFGERWPMGQARDIGILFLQNKLKRHCGDDAQYIMDALVALYNRTYWQRIWIVQEIALAPNVILMCGDKQVLWSTFVEATLKFPGPLQIRDSERSTFPDKQAILRIQDVRTRYKKSKGVPIAEEDRVAYDSRREDEGALLRPLMDLTLSPMDFLGVVLQFDYAKATDPRDKIYGLLSLARDADSLVSSPDYEQDYIGLCIKFTTSVIKATGKLNVCGVSASAKNRHQDLPGWALDPMATIDRGMLHKILTTTDAERSNRGLLPQQQNMQNTKAACGDGQYQTQRPAVAWKATRPFLPALGVIIDTVDGLGGIVNTTEKNFTSPEQPVTEQKMMYGGPNKLINALWRSMVLNHDHFPSEKHWLNVGDVRDFYDNTRLNKGYPFVDQETWLWCKATHDLLVAGRPLGDWFKEWRPEEPQQPRTRQPRDTQARHEAKTEFTVILKRVMQHKRMLVTQKGKIGMAPHAAHKSDKIAVVFGVDVPVVLRPLQSGGHSVVGEAYIHGMMRGQAVENIEEKAIVDLELY